METGNAFILCTHRVYAEGLKIVHPAIFLCVQAYIMCRLILKLRCTHRVHRYQNEHPAAKLYIPGAGCTLNFETHKSRT